MVFIFLKQTNVTLQISDAENGADLILLLVNIKTGKIENIHHSSFRFSSVSVKIFNITVEWAGNNPLRMLSKT